MMQNDMSSNYMLNGFDKSGSSYSFTNSNASIVQRNISRAQVKNTNSTRTTTRVRNSERTPIKCTWNCFY